MAPNQVAPLFNLDASSASPSENENNKKIRVAILGVGMMGQEHISYISGYSNDLQIDFLCDPHPPSLANGLQVLEDFYAKNNRDDDHDDDTEEDSQDDKQKKKKKSLFHIPMLLDNEQELLKHVDAIDLLVIASPNHLHTDSLCKWAPHEHLTILVEKPVAVSHEQYNTLVELQKNQNCKANIWVAMEYRYIPAIAKLLQLLPQVGDIKMVTIRENRYPFLHKIGRWNRNPLQTGDTLVEKCCHFFDLFSLITKQTVQSDKIRVLAQRGLNYTDEDLSSIQAFPIIDSAYVILPFTSSTTPNVPTMGCLELCMFAEGSRHQEEIIVTGSKGRLEAYLPENKVYLFHRPDSKQWHDRSIPPPPDSIKQEVFDCSDVKRIHDISQELPTHVGYHYSSTSVEWYHLIQTLRRHRAGEEGEWNPHVSLADGLRAVEMGLNATRAIVNEQEGDDDNNHQAKEKSIESTSTTV